MKRDSEWMKEEFRKLERAGVIDSWVYRDLWMMANQLDEPEVLSQEWIEEHRKSYTMEDSVEISDLQNLLVPKQEEITESFKETVRKLIETSDLAMDVQKLTGMTLEEIKEEAINGGIVPKQELPAIPKFVAEYLDFAKSDTTLMRVLELANTRNEWEKWEREYDWIEENHELFARAWLDGYEVAEEQKYLVNILDEGIGAYLIYYPKSGNYGVTGILDDSKGITRFTEQEIKDYDKRYWFFAKPVE